MAKYRGFEKELPELAGLGFHGPGVQAPAPAPAPAPVRAPAPAYTPTIVAAPIVPGKIQPGIPGDIRDIVARDLPGEAVTDADDMSAENGIPGVDDSGAFPYGDPKGNGLTVTEKGGNQGLIIAAILAALLLGG